MPPPPERRRRGIVAGYAVLLAAVGLAATPAYVYAESPNRPVIVRLAIAVVVGVVLLHLLRITRARIAAQAPSAFEAALVPARAELRLAPLFVALRDEIRFSVAHQRYFEHVLWRRLLELTAGRRGRSSDGWPAKPPGRLLGRGPSLATLRRLIDEIEDQP